MIIVYVQYKGTKNVNALKKFVMPDRFKADVRQPQIFVRQGKKELKACETLLSLVSSMRAFRGTLQVACTNTEEMSFEQACEVVADMNPTNFESFMAAAFLAVKRNKANQLQTTVNLLEVRLRHHVETLWKASNCTFTLLCTHGPDWEELPEWVWKLPAYAWTSLGQVFKVFTLWALFFTSVGFDYSVVLAGPPEGRKSSLLHSLCKLATKMNGRDFYLVVNSLDDYGTLTLKGRTQCSGVNAFDDADPTTGGAGGHTLTEDEGKSLFTVRFGSSYDARYCAATFPAKCKKIFATNLNINRTPVMPSEFCQRFPWIQYAAQNDATSMKLLSDDSQAQARRAAVVYISDPIVSADIEEQQAEEDDREMACMLARLER
jgi:hypothetical protein